ncbi:hypothetical protein B0H14DRAFT_3437924 [Mycena olivaceomarginata]|nr:hypothetical protein B0H14DRAFT_3437924 [Mycena olivaceomarginata]
MDDSFTEVEPGGETAANAEGKGRGPRLSKGGIDIDLDWEGGEEVEDDENEREDNEDVVETSEKEEEVENALRNKDPPQDGDDSVKEGTNTASLLVLPSKYARIVEREREDRSIQKDADDAQNDDDVLPGSSPIYSSPVEPQYSPSANHDVFILYKQSQAQSAGCYLWKGCAFRRLRDQTICQRKLNRKAWEKTS